MSENDDCSLFCHRCGAVLTPGAGNFYIVRIEAFADPTPSALDPELSAAAVSEEVNRLLQQLGRYSDQELMDQIYRRLTIHLCRACYDHWIEHPAG